MSTVIYPSPISGIIHSRRLGLSLGINLMPDDGKVCTFDCIYCECGFNQDHIATHRRPTREEVAIALERKLIELNAADTKLDVITFSGNGEPTAHPDFSDIVDDVIRLRDRYCPQAKVSVLSNSTMIFRPDVHAALMRVDNNILKLDTVSTGYIHLVDRPTQSIYHVERIIEGLKSFRGHVIIQTIFMKGTFEGNDVDNTGDTFVKPWLKALIDIQPREVMIYTIDRETPASNLEKATVEELNSIRDRVRNEGILCTASY